MKNVEYKPSKAFQEMKRQSNLQERRKSTEQLDKSQIKSIFGNFPKKNFEIDSFKKEYCFENKVIKPSKNNKGVNNLNLPINSQRKPFADKIWGKRVSFTQVNKEYKNSLVVDDEKKLNTSDFQKESKQNKLKVSFLLQSPEKEHRKIESSSYLKNKKISPILKMTETSSSKPFKSTNNKSPSFLFFNKICQLKSKYKSKPLTPQFKNKSNLPAKQRFFEKNGNLSSDLIRSTAEKKFNFHQFIADGINLYADQRQLSPLNATKSKLKFFRRRSEAVDSLNDNLSIGKKFKDLDEKKNSKDNLNKAYAKISSIASNLVDSHQGAFTERISEKLIPKTVFCNSKQNKEQENELINMSESIFTAKNDNMIQENMPDLILKEDIDWKEIDKISENESHDLIMNPDQQCLMKNKRSKVLRSFDSLTLRASSEQTENSLKNEGKFHFWNHLLFTKQINEELSKLESKKSIQELQKLPSTRRDSFFSIKVDAEGPSQHEKTIWFKNHINHIPNASGVVYNIDVNSAENISEITNEHKKYDLPSLNFRTLLAFKNLITNESENLKFISSNERKLPRFEAAKTGSCSNAIAKRYAANTHNGIQKAENEDRISIKIKSSFFQQNQQNSVRSKNISSGSLDIFSIFDGHGDSFCSNFLKDNFNKKLAMNLEKEGILVHPIKDLFKEIDKDILELALKQKRFQSGSCLISLLILEEMVVVLNLGDSRAIASKFDGKDSLKLTNDHKPENLTEFSKIIEKGGKLFRESINTKTKESFFHFATTFQNLREINKLKENNVSSSYSPWRIWPGGLSVSRTFGDLSSKKTEFGGKEDTVSAEPDIFDFDPMNLDFIFMAC